MEITSRVLRMHSGEWLLKKRISFELRTELFPNLRSALKAADSKSDLVIYPKAGHGFHADYRPSYREEDARTAGVGCRIGSRNTARCNAPHR